MLETPSNATRTSCKPHSKNNQILYDKTEIFITILNANLCTFQEIVDYSETQCFHSEATSFILQTFLFSIVFDNNDLEIKIIDLVYNCMDSIVLYMRTISPPITYAHSKNSSDIYVTKQSMPMF